MEPTHFPLDTFVEEVRPVLQIMAKMLRRDNTNIVDKSILGMFSFVSKKNFYEEISADRPIFINQCRFQSTTKLFCVPANG